LLHIYNTLTSQIDKINTVEPGIARLYTCGPTVYRHAHIGNLRSYLLSDWIRRALENQGVKVNHIKNITDVGHMRQDVLEEEGDKVILAALAEGKTPEEIARFYTQSFYQDESKLNIAPAHAFPKASAFVPQMVEMINHLLQTGHAYKVEGNIYFNVSTFPQYGALSGNSGSTLQQGMTTNVDPFKKDPRDFALWKAAEKGRQMKWESPWGEGFPGWHIECSAMSTYYLGQEQDIHTGGVDNIFPHHEDEIAQSQAASTKQYVKYWVHGQHLLANGIKMSKSTNNEILLSDLERRSISPMSFRYLCLTVKYRHRMNFTFPALKAAERSLTRLKDIVWSWHNMPYSKSDYDEQLPHWQIEFWKAVNNDLDLPNALALTWMMIRSSLNVHTKLKLIQEFDSVLGLGLTDVPGTYPLSDENQSKIKIREQSRLIANYRDADAIRDSILTTDTIVRDTPSGTLARPKTPFELQSQDWPTFSSPKKIASFIEHPSSIPFSLIITSGQDLNELKKAVDSIIRWSEASKYELILIDNDTYEYIGPWLNEATNTLENLTVLHFDQKLGAAQAINMGLKQSQGEIVVILDPATEFTGDLLGQIEFHMSDASVSVIGPWGLRTNDLRHFHEEVIGVQPADAMQIYCFAFRRQLLKQVGLMRECFHFYRNLDLDFSFQFRNLGHQIVSDDSMPVTLNTPSIWNLMEKGQIDKLSKKNFGHFLKRWRHRKDLLISSS